MTRSIASVARLDLTQEGYLQQLRTLGAWWCFGSSALAPGLVMSYAPARLATLRAAGL